MFKLSIILTFGRVVHVGLQVELDRFLSTAADKTISAQGPLTHLFWIFCPPPFSVSLSKKNYFVLHTFDSLTN